jgi:hypothetical protein
MSAAPPPADPEAKRVAQIRAAGRRALAEAATRRRAAPALAPTGEKGGRAGLEPTRYGDWEKAGLAIDF